MDSYTPQPYPLQPRIVGLSGMAPERLLIDWCHQYINPQSTFVDAGAHCGTYALTLAPHCRQVWAFEPQEEQFYLLCSGIVMNGYRNVHARMVGLGSPEDHGTRPHLNIISPDGGGSTLTPLRGERAGKLLQTRRIELRTLDSYQLDHVSLIKIDVEGWEESVLRGAADTIQRCHPHIFYEAWSDPEHANSLASLQDYIRQIGYRTVAVTGGQDMYIASPSG